MMKLLLKSVLILGLFGTFARCKPVPVSETAVRETFVDIPWKMLEDPLKDVEEISKLADIVLEEGVKLGEVFRPFDWLELGRAEYDKKREFLNLPDIGLGCNELYKTTKDSYYTFTEFRDCVYNPEYLLGSQEEIFGWGDDTQKPYILETPFAHFGKWYKKPQLVWITSNGYVTLTKQQPSVFFSPNITEGKPYNILGGLFSDLDTGRSSNVVIGKYRMGYKVVCTRFQWNNFRTYTTYEFVDFQFDVCSNGYFIIRIGEAQNLDSSQIGLNLGNDKEGVVKSAALEREDYGYSYQDRSTFVIKPNKKVDANELLEDVLDKIDWFEKSSSSESSAP